MKPGTFGLLALGVLGYVAYVGTRSESEASTTPKTTPVNTGVVPPWMQDRIQDGVERVVGGGMDAGTVAPPPSLAEPVLRIQPFPFPSGGDPVMRGPILTEERPEERLVRPPKGFNDAPNKLMPDFELDRDDDRRTVLDDLRQRKRYTLFGTPRIGKTFFSK